MVLESEGCVFITGATRGIGRATAEFLHKKGFSIAATGRNTHLIADLESDKMAVISCDVTDERSVLHAVEEARARFGGIAAVVNNAGYGIPAPVDTVSTQEVANLFEVNVFGAHRVARAVIPEMKRNSRGIIVNISSAAGRIVTPNLGIYSASKFALEALSDAMRVELRPYGVHVVLVEPGPIATSFGERSREELRRVASRLEREDPERAKELSRFWENGLGLLDRFRKDPHSVARVIHRALTAKRPQPRYRVTLLAWAAEVGRVLPARITDSIFSRDDVLFRFAKSPRHSE